MRSDVDANAEAIVRLSTWRDRVFEMMADRIRRQLAQLGDPAVARETRGVAAKIADDAVIRMLIRRGDGAEHNIGLHRSNLARECERVSIGGLEMRIAAEVLKLDLRA